MFARSRPPLQPLSRRAALRGAVSGLGAGLIALAVCGCDVRWVSGAETTPTVDRGPDDDAREAAVADTRDLLGLLLPAAGGAEPLRSAAMLAVQTCEAHLRALGETQLEVTATVTSSAGTAAVEAPTILDRLAVAAGSALTAASAAEAAPSAGMARLLASIGASRAVLLDDVGSATGVPAPAVALPAAASQPTATTTTTATPSAPADRAGTAALQAALAGEHAAVYGFGLVQGRLSDPRRSEAAADQAAHRVARDDLGDVLVARGADPVQAEVGYDVDAPTSEAALALAATMDGRLCGAYADLVAASSPDRGLAVAALLVSARSARRWGSTVTSFPGLAELAEDGTSVPSATSSATATATTTP